MKLFHRRTEDAINFNNRDNKLWGWLLRRCHLDKQTTAAQNQSGTKKSLNSRQDEKMKQRRVINPLICGASNLWLIWDYTAFISGLATFSGVKPHARLENSYFPWLKGRKCPSSHRHLWWSSVGTHGSMGACLCGCVISAWSVHLAVVQWAAHGIMMTAAAASVGWRGWKKSKNSWEEINHKKRKEEWSTESQNDAEKPNPEKGRSRAGKGGEARQAVFTLDYFCGVVPVCSSCGRWIIRNGMSLPPAAFSVFHERRSENSQEQQNKLPTACSPPSRWGRGSATRIDDARWPRWSVGLTWQQSSCNSPVAPRAALIQGSGLHRDNPKHMWQTHTQLYTSTLLISLGRLQKRENNQSRCHTSLTHPCVCTITFVIA